MREFHHHGSNHHKMMSVPELHSDPSFKSTYMALENYEGNKKAQ
jgi:hypothetical protein